MLAAAADAVEGGADAEDAVRPLTPSLYQLGTAIESSGFHYHKRSHYLNK